MPKIYKDDGTFYYYYYKKKKGRKKKRGPKSKIKLKEKKYKHWDFKIIHCISKKQNLLKLLNKFWKHDFLVWLIN